VRFLSDGRNRSELKEQSTVTAYPLSEAQLCSNRSKDSLKFLHPFLVLLLPAAANALN
jgi:hypothetical protein